MRQILLSEKHGYLISVKALLELNSATLEHRQSMQVSWVLIYSETPNSGPKEPRIREFSAFLKKTRNADSKISR